MMQTAEPRHRYDLVASYGIRSGFAAGRRSLRQREMRAVVMVVADVLFHQPFQMAFIEHDHMVEQVSSTATNPTFGDTVLPRTSEAGSFGLDAEAFDGADDFFVEVRSSVENEMFRGAIVGECFPQLLHDPRTVWMSCDIPVKDAPPVMRDDEEAVQHTEDQRRHGEEIHRSDGFPMVAQKCRPPLCRFRTPRRLPHPAQNGSLGNIEAKHGQLTVDAWSAPGSVLSNHAEDEIAQFLANASSAHAGAMS